MRLVTSAAIALGVFGSLGLARAADVEQSRDASLGAPSDARGTWPSSAPGEPALPSHAPDGERSAALIASSIVFGVGGAAAGIAYVVTYEADESKCNSAGSAPANPPVQTVSLGNPACDHGSARAPLMTYGALVGITPSVPRFVVGDTTYGLLFTGLRVASIAAAALIPWGKNDDASWSGPFLLGFAAPVALAIVDLATTPHREDLAPETAGITSVAPVALADRTGTHGGMITIGGRF